MSDRGLRFRLGVWLAVALVCGSAAAASGPLFPGAQYDVGWYPMSVAIGDLNGDDCLDLAAANNMQHRDVVAHVIRRLPRPGGGE